METITNALMTLSPGNELRIVNSESNRVLAHRAAKQAAIDITTKVVDDQIVIRLQTDLEMIHREELGLQVVPIRGRVVGGITPVVGAYVWWAPKLNEAVPLDVLKSLGEEEVMRRAQNGTFQRVYNHPLIETGRDDSLLWKPVEAADSTEKMVEEGHSTES